LVSPETAAASALTGVLTNPQSLQGLDLTITIPSQFILNDNMIVPPNEENTVSEVVRGPNIKAFPLNQPLTVCKGKALIKVEDNITTDHIMPSNASLLPFRSNIPYLAEYCLVPCDKEFPTRAKSYGGGFIVGGENYGQGSSREHAALAPLQLGIKAVLAKSFARIHKANLMNSGIIPLIFINPSDYDTIDILDDLEIPTPQLQVLNEDIIVKNLTKNLIYQMKLEASQRDREMLLVGGKINSIR
jgi:aconitate hydratase